MTTTQKTYATGRRKHAVAQRAKRGALRWGALRDCEILVQARAVAALETVVGP